MSKVPCTTGWTQCGCQGDATVLGDHGNLGRALPGAKHFSFSASNFQKLGSIQSSEGACFKRKLYFRANLTSFKLNLMTGRAHFLHKKEEHTRAISMQQFFRESYSPLQGFSETTAASISIQKQRYLWIKCGIMRPIFPPIDTSIFSPSCQNMTLSSEKSETLFLQISLNSQLHSKVICFRVQFWVWFRPVHAACVTYCAK